MKKKKRREGHTGEANCKTIRRRRNEKERGDLKEREGGRERPSSSSSLFFSGTLQASWLPTQLNIHQTHTLSLSLSLFS